MGAYRDSNLICPACNAALRTYGRRLVCDACQGMLISEADFASAVQELDGSAAPLLASDLAENQQPCPRCHGVTTSCTLTIGALMIPGRFLRCEVDGVWMPQDAMAATFARVSRRAHLGGGRGRTYGGAGRLTTDPALPGSSRGMPGAIASITDAFGHGPATAGLGIATGAGISHVHSVYVSPFKQRALACPACEGGALGYQGDRWACTTCGGSFVENAALRGMVEDITGGPWELAAPHGRPSARACPLCAAAMVAEDLEDVPVDRCAKHGIWFDARELAAVLEHAGTDQPRSPGGWLRRLFHRG